MSAVAPPAQQRSHPHAGGSGAKPKLYNPRHPEQTLLYRTIAEYFETWLELASAGQFDGQGDYHTPPVYVEHTFRSERHIRSAEHHLSPSLLSGRAVPAICQENKKWHSNGETDCIDCQTSQTEDRNVQKSGYRWRRYWAIP